MHCELGTSHNRGGIPIRDMDHIIGVKLLPVAVGSLDDVMHLSLRSDNRCHEIYGDGDHRLAAPEPRPVLTQRLGVGRLAGA